MIRKDSYSKNSRLTSKEEAKAFKKLAMLFVLVIVIALAFIFMGLPMLISFSSFVTSQNDSTKSITGSRDTIAPFPPRFDSLPEATNSATLIVKGFAEAGSTVELSSESITLSLIADKEGEFSTQLKLVTGINTISAIAVDNAGNKSSPSQALKVELKTTKPTLEVQEPTEGKSLSGSDNAVTVNGKIENGGSITVNGRFVSIDQGGKFQTQVLLSSGENKIEVIAKDKAGNETKTERKVTYNP